MVKAAAPSSAAPAPGWTSRSVVVDTAEVAGSAAPPPGWTLRAVVVDVAAMVCQSSRGARCATLHAKPDGGNAASRARASWIDLRMAGTEREGGVAVWGGMGILSLA